MTGRHQRRKPTATDEVAVVFVCQWCGQRVELRASDTGPELADSRLFIARHADCLRRSLSQPGPRD